MSDGGHVSSIPISWLILNRKQSLKVALMIKGEETGIVWFWFPISLFWLLWWLHLITLSIYNNDILSWYSTVLRSRYDCIAPEKKVCWKTFHNMVYLDMFSVSRLFKYHFMLCWKVLNYNKKYDLIKCVILIRFQ